MTEIDLLDSIIDEARAASGRYYAEEEARPGKTVSEEQVYEHAHAIYCTRRRELAAKHGVSVVDVAKREAEHRSN